MLFNPPWWWHAIENTTPTTVAIASRWHTDGIVGDKLVPSEEKYELFPLGSLMFQTGFASWPFLHEILQTPSPRNDEHMTLREKNNRFAAAARQIHKDGGLKILGVTSKF